ncbi:hypothetical protein HWQ67_08535 [Candidatus Magnetobacterium casensis]|uniref:Uncharacterized protein n=1 Tax=Candidatus Magnetobacterium casense TaxID=1455061 RepID=A0ABS6RYE6_9BACT|nr:hypothetical protein [Candidatus Magnetobacterium casensis]
MECYLDFYNAEKFVITESNKLIERVDNISCKVNDSRLQLAKSKLQGSKELAQRQDDPESAKQAFENILEAKRLVANTRKEHITSIRNLELENLVSMFEEYTKQYAKESELISLENMIKRARNVIDYRTSDFENIIEQMKHMSWLIFWRQEGFVINIFKNMQNEEYLYTDKDAFRYLIKLGTEAIKQEKIEELRKIIFKLYSIRIVTYSEQDMFLQSNIL